MAREEPSPKAVRLVFIQLRLILQIYLLNGHRYISIIFFYESCFVLYYGSLNLK